MCLGYIIALFSHECVRVEIYGKGSNEIDYDIEEIARSDGDGGCQKQNQTLIITS